MSLAMVEDFDFFEHLVPGLCGAFRNNLKRKSIYVVTKAYHNDSVAHVFINSDYDIHICGNFCRNTTHRKPEIKCKENPMDYLVRPANRKQKIRKFSIHYAKNFTLTAYSTPVDAFLYVDTKP